MSNTLFNYFKKADGSTPSKTPSKTPAKTPSKPVLKESNRTPARETETKDKTKKNESKDEEIIVEKMDTDDEEIITSKKYPASESKKKRLSEESDSPKKTKRRRIVIESDSGDSEVENEKKNKNKNKSVSDIESMPEEDEDVDDDEEEEVKPKKKIQKKTVISQKNISLAEFSSPKTPRSTSGAASSASTASPASKASLATFLASNLETDSNSVNLLPDGKYKHQTFSFLEEDKIKDINGRLKSDPDYDPRTLYIPPEFKKNFTPAHKQWWELKSTNFDVGKFYELYHMDAMIAVKELGLTFMKGDYAHCGFPEISFSRFADSLVSKGYKVGRIEQTETPEMMSDRVKGTRQDKTVKREICRITTPGTKTFNLLDSEVSNTFSQYLFSVVEKMNLNQEKKTRSYGVCFVDTTVGKINIGQFEDDRNCSKLRTTLAHYPPAHILYDKSNISKETKHIIDLQNCLKDGLTHEKEMYPAGKLLKLLTEGSYFREKDEFTWPANFKPVLSEHDSLGLTARGDFELAVNAMGGVVWCMQNCLIDEEILSMRNFEIYEPVDNVITSDIQKKSEIRSAFNKQKYMVLDSISLTNLEIIENNFDNTQAGTLFEQLDYCNTAFGKRLLKYWIVNPLCDADAINDRLDAIEDLKQLDENFVAITDMLKSLPDLERLLSKIHQLGNISKEHPDSRAIMYENDTYSKKKVEDFITILNGFIQAAKLLNRIKEFTPLIKSNLLKSILTITKHEKNRPSTGFPYLDDLLKFYQKSFDAEKAKKDGKIIPSAGVNEEYDAAINDIKSIEREFDSYLRAQSKVFACTLSYFGTSKNRYQLEIPEAKCKHVSNDYELVSSKKGFKRYWTDDIKSMIAALTEAEERRDQALRNTMKCLFKNFDNHYNIWNRAVQCLSILDVLLSLTSYVKNAEHEMCRPEILLNDDESRPFIDIRNGRHPCLTKTFSGDFIPNDILIGCEKSSENWQKSSLMIITGPNMGGKSTLMRQTGLSVILAQMGCYVPAEKCRLTPVDRIFTRIGASDKILAGESTFFLELSETASILHHATKHSLVLMDELGRGTATFDGTAIAFSVVKELAQKIKSRTLFSTHYHHLVEEFSDKDGVSMGHMQSIVSDEDQSITFLYKFGEGACPKSHGFNAARLADIPDEIIKLGSEKSNEFENFSKRIQLLKKTMHLKSKEDLKKLIDKFEGLGRA